MQKVSTNSKVPRCLVPDENQEQATDKSTENQQEPEVTKEKPLRERKMFRIPPNSKVRRRLFSEDSVEDQARTDNFTNILQESIARDVQEKSTKYNFNFEKELPLYGVYEWFQKNGDEWIGMKVEYDDTEMPEHLIQQHENENTPVQVRDESVPIIRKRRKEIETGTRNQTVKRRVDFDSCSFLRRLDY